MSRKKKNVIASIFHVTVPDLKAQPLTRGLNVAKRGPFGKHMVAGTISAVDHRGPGVFFAREDCLLGEISRIAAIFHLCYGFSPKKINWNCLD